MNEYAYDECRSCTQLKETSFYSTQLITMVLNTIDVSTCYILDEKYINGINVICMVLT